MVYYTSPGGALNCVMRMPDEGVKLITNGWCRLVNDANIATSIFSSLLFAASLVLKK